MFKVRRYYSEVSPAVKMISSGKMNKLLAQPAELCMMSFLQDEGTLEASLYLLEGEVTENLQSSEMVLDKYMRSCLNLLQCYLLRRVMTIK